MMSNQDIRWQQRFNSYCQALNLMDEAVQQSESKGLNDLEKQGLIQLFESTHELAWNLLKDYLNYQGISALSGSRDATREAFHKGLIYNGEQWMEMIKSRNLSSHTYSQAIADELIERIVHTYLPLLLQLKDRFTQLLTD